LLPPLGEVEIDLGQREMIDEVLGVDVACCAAQYAVAMYMIAAPDQRAAAVCTAIDEMSGIESFWEPLSQMEQVAIEPLAGFELFLPRWRELIEQGVATEKRFDSDVAQPGWLREVAQRTQGVDGLAELARSSRRPDDLRAWCRMLVEARDWEAALSSYEEAVEIVSESGDSCYTRSEMLDGAALAAQELGRADLPDRLQRA